MAGEVELRGLCKRFDDADGHELAIAVKGQDCIP